MRKKFALVGLAIGIIFSVGTIVYVFWQAPAPPGSFETLAIIFVCGTVVAVWTVTGFLVGLVFEFARRRARAMKDRGEKSSCP